MFLSFFFTKLCLFPMHVARGDYANQRARFAQGEDYREIAAGIRTPERPPSDLLVRMDIVRCQQQRLIEEGFLSLPVIHAGPGVLAEISGIPIKAADKLEIHDGCTLLPETVAMLASQKRARPLRRSGGRVCGARASPIVPLSFPPRAGAVPPAFEDGRLPQIDSWPAGYPSGQTFV